MALVRNRLKYKQAARCISIKAPSSSLPPQRSSEPFSTVYGHMVMCSCMGFRSLGMDSIELSLLCPKAETQREREREREMGRINGSDLILNEAHARFSGNLSPPRVELNWLQLYYMPRKVLFKELAAENNSTPLTSQIQSFEL
ncbi:hypothetical protein VNO77_17963 [Canavalia gladiata]|uniref:Uncharacterized protein n=1 Tax=Canavalia gladiata TaxID=3824 RepID=A0AAN9LJY7_CANGL